MATIGIDLGTTNSLGAVYINGKPELIPNRFGSFLTPSVVGVDENGQILVGEIAKARRITHPQNTAASFKKDMGTDKKILLGDKSFAPEELSSFVIRSVVEDAERFLGERVEEAVISVPAYFHDSQREATKRAGALAGIFVQRIINEPSAAALAEYYEQKEERLIVVFDFGGGTLDVSVVECFDTMVEILAVSGDNRLGGDNFHEVMVEHFLKEHQIEKVSVSEKELAILVRQAEKCKVALSEGKEAVMTGKVNGDVCRSVYTNERLMEESGQILLRIKKVLTHALRDGNLTLGDVDAVVMVGGSSKMPMVQSYLRHLFHKQPVVSDCCDELIARGLGVLCGVKTRDADVKDYILTDICPFTLGTDVLNEADPEHSYMSPIVERNSVLPCSVVKRFYTNHDNQTKIDVRILQGEHNYADDNVTLGRMSVAVPRNHAGKEAVDLRFTYDINGILIVDVTVVSTQKTITKMISGHMDEEETKRRAAELEKLKVHPKALTENKLILEKLQMLYEEASPNIREQIQEMIRKFEYYLNQQDQRRIRKYRTYLEQVIDQLETYDPFSVFVVLDGMQGGEEWEESAEEDAEYDWEDGEAGEKEDDE